MLMPISTRFADDDNRTLADLHLCLQEAFGWENYHLHEFEFDHMVFGELSDDEDRVIIGDDIVSLDLPVRLRGRSASSTSRGLRGLTPFV
jgi:hypothetical protein